MQSFPMAAKMLSAVLRNATQQLSRANTTTLNSLRNLHEYSVAVRGQKTLPGQKSSVTMDNSLYSYSPIVGRPNSPWCKEVIFETGKVVFNSAQLRSSSRGSSKFGRSRAKLNLHGAQVANK